MRFCHPNEKAGTCNNERRVRSILLLGSRGVMSEESFQSQVAQAIILYEKTIRHAASRTRQMIDELGEKKALSRLMISADLQQGFKALRDSNQLDSTFEAIVVRFSGLFSPEVVEAAKWRLENPYQLL
jgi:hypothetical protein